MKTLKYIFIFFCIVNGYSQTLIDLNEVESKFTVNKQILNALDLYGIDRDVEVYNIFPNSSKSDFFMLAILPDNDYTSAKALNPACHNERVYNWKEIVADSINKESGSASILQIRFSILSGEVEDTQRVRVLKEENNKSYISRYAILQYFQVEELPSFVETNYQTLNLDSKSISIREFQEMFGKKFPGNPFPLDVRRVRMGRNLDLPLIPHKYLSKTFMMGRLKMYQFWTYDGWWEADGDNSYRGIDRFIYVPRTGIVGGSFDFYFKNDKTFAIPTDRLWDNIINERVMIAEELKTK